MAAKSELRQQFESARRRSAFFTALAGMGIGIIATDTWLAPQLGVLGGLLGGGVGYGAVFGYETLMWRRNHDR